MRNNVLKHLNFLHDLIFTVQSCKEYSTVLPSQTFGIIFNNEVMFELDWSMSEEFQIECRKRFWSEFVLQYLAP